MRTGLKTLLVLTLGLYALQGEGGERLGGISDETAPSAEQPAEREGGIVYRVICSPEGEQLPECQQAPVNDSFEAAQPRRAEPEIPDMPAVGEMPNEDTERDDQPAKALEPVAAEKAPVHKKRSKKIVNKSGKKTDKQNKPNKRKHR